MSVLSETPTERPPETAEEPRIPDIQPQPVRNTPSEALVTRLSQQVTDLEAAVARMRRRMRIERGLFALALLAAAGFWLAPVVAPGVWALEVNGRPVVAMRDRAAVETVLAQVKQQGVSGPGAALLETVKISRTDPGSVPITDPQTAAERLKEALATSADRGVIYVDGNPAVALPDPEQASELLEKLKERATKKLDRVESEPRFKEQVEVRTEPAPRDLWADGETALGLLTGEGEGKHAVRIGENAWGIAQKNDMSLADLRRLNPGVNLERLQAGQQLAVGKGGEAVVTVVTTGELTETIPTPFRTLTTPRPLMWAGKRVRARAGVPGRERVSYKVTFENGKAVRREILERTVIQAPRDQVIAVGTKPRP